ncbi:MAG: putative DNA-binding domain-containing protein [Pseudomonadota bacterium]|nr:putative DNA-binding domain-containing protein [Pseudomonadota bacterium]
MSGARGGPVAPGLAALQHAFAAWLRSDHAAVPPPLRAVVRPHGADQAERLAIYRRSSRHAQRQALAAAYPVIAALLGAELFQALCEDHLRVPGSRAGDLHCLGEGFCDTLRAEAACAGLDFLPEVARLEWLVHRSFFAADQTSAVALDPGVIAPHELPRLRPILAPGLALLACATPAGRIWRAHQPDSPERLADIDPAAGPEWLAVRRVAAGVCLDSLSAQEFALLEALERGLTLAQALDALNAPAPPLAAWLPRWLQSGLVLGLTLADG